MPENTIRKIMTATEPADVAQMAMIECVRQLADNGKATNEILKGMQVELRDVRERVIRIEASEFKAGLSATRDEIERLRKEELARLDERVDALEAKENHRAGAKGFATLLREWAPLTGVLLTAAFIVLVATGRVVL